MDMMIDLQVALDEALVPHASRLRIGKSNFRLRSDITSKESTLQLVYDVLRLTPFYKAFLVNADVLEIYMHEFWSSATVHHHSIRFKMDNMKCIVNMEYFREMMYICPRFLGQIFDELPFKEEILAFLSFLRHSEEIRKLTDNVDFAYLLWDDFVYQIEHKDAKKINKMYYPRFIKVIIHYFMTKDTLIPRRNKVNWHYVRDDQRNSEAYKEYYAVASGATPPKTKASVRKTKSSSDTTITPLTAAGTRLSTSVKGIQPAKASKAKGLTVLFEVAMTEAEQMKISWKSSDEDDEVDERSDDQDDDDQDDDDQDDDDQDQDTDNDGDEFIHPKLSIHEEETKYEECFDPIVQTPKNSNDKGNDDASLGLNVVSEEGQDAEDDDEELYRDININLEGRDVQIIDVHTTLEFKDTHVTLTMVNPDGQQQNNSSVDVQASTTVASLTLTAPTLPPPTTPTTQAENEEFLNNLDENNQKIIKEQVQKQVKVQVSKIFSKIEKTVNVQLEAKVLTRSSNCSKTSYAMAADLSEMELKKILIDKMESIKEGKEPESTSAPKEKTTKTTGKSTQGSKSHQTTASKSAPISDLAKQDDCRPLFNELMDTPMDFLAFLINRLKVDTLTPELLVRPTYELMKGSCKSLVELEFFIEEVYKATTDQLDWNNPERQQYPHNLLKPLPLIPNSQGHRIIPFDHFINNDLKYLHGGASNRKYTTSVTKTKAADYRHIKWIEDLVPRTMWINRKSTRDVYLKCRIIAVTELQIVEWHNYKHLDWITVHRDDDKLYKFKEGNFKRLRIQDIEDIMFTRSIIIQRLVEDLQLGVESYQKKLKLTKPDTYRSDLKCKEAYTAYFNLRGFIYQNKDKHNRLMRIDELHKFYDGTLNDVQTALDDCLKGIWMKYLPQAIWRKSGKERAAAMIQDFDKQIKKRRIM
nr:hypothetical protein [Tanacetum cinerariifolium]